MVDKSKLPIHRVENLENELNQTLNYNNITNCILENPDNPISYSHTTVTIKAGIKVAGANGRIGAFGKLSNIYGTSTEISFNETGLGSTRELFLLANNPTITTSRDIRNIFEQEEAPQALIISGATGLWLNTLENKWYEVSATSGIPNWVVSANSYVKIATFTLDATTITSLIPEFPVEIEKKINIQDYIVDYGSNNNGWYRKYKSGWIEQGGNYQSIASESSQVYNFPIPFINIPASFNTNCRRFNDNDALIVFNYDIITTTTFSGVSNYVRGGASNEISAPFYFYACGY